MVYVDLGEYIIYGLWTVYCVWLVILEAFLLREEDLWELCYRVLFYIGFEGCEVFYWCISEVDTDYRPPSSVYGL